jgi:hypothetical protein
MYYSNRQLLACSKGQGHGRLTPTPAPGYKYSNDKLQRPTLRVNIKVNHNELLASWPVRTYLHYVKIPYLLFNKNNGCILKT